MTGWWVWISLRTAMLNISAIRSNTVFTLHLKGSQFWLFPSVMRNRADLMCLKSEKLLFSLCKLGLRIINHRQIIIRLSFWFWCGCSLAEHCCVYCQNTEMRSLISNFLVPSTLRCFEHSLNCIEMWGTVMSRVTVWGYVGLTGLLFGESEYLYVS